MIEQFAADNGWLTEDTTLNQFYRTSRSENLNIRSTSEPIKGFRGRSDCQQTKNNSQQVIFRANSNGDFNKYNPVETGSYSISVLTFGTAFNINNDNYSSATFQKFREPT